MSDLPTELQDIVDMLDLDFLDSFDANNPPDTSDLEKLINLNDNEPLGLGWDSFASASLFTLAPLAPQPVQQEQIMLEAKATEPELGPAAEDPILVPALQGLDIKPGQCAATRYSRRKPPMAVRTCEDEAVSLAPPTPQPEEMEGKKTRSRKRKASDADADADAQLGKTPKRRQKQLKTKKPKMWQNKNDPKSKDAVLAHERREKKKKELAEAKARIQTLEREIATNYIHKDDAAALVQRVVDLGHATMAEDGPAQEPRDFAVAVASAEVDPSTTG